MTTTFHRLAEKLPRDSPVIADLVRVWREAREDRLRFLTDLHGPDEDAAYLSGTVLPENEVWVAQVGSVLAGFIAFARGWVNHLYVAPRFQGRAIGTGLLAIAMRSNPALHLWAFEENLPAIRFYERRGFRIVERTDGASNEARRPDLRMRWVADGDRPGHIERKVRRPTHELRATPRQCPECGARPTGSAVSCEAARRGQHA